MPVRVLKTAGDSNAGLAVCAWVAVWRIDGGGATRTDARAVRNGPGDAGLAAVSAPAAVHGAAASNATPSRARAHPRGFDLTVLAMFPPPLCWKRAATESEPPTALAARSIYVRR